MFLEVRRGPKTFVQHKDMDSQFLAPVNSNFRINMDLIAELSVYSLKEDKHKKGLDNQPLIVPMNSLVIHLEMLYTHSTQQVKRAGNEYTVNERYYYKLVFFPEAEEEFMRIKTILDNNTAN